MNDPGSRRLVWALGLGVAVLFAYALLQDSRRPVVRAGLGAVRFLARPTVALACLALALLPRAVVPLTWNEAPDQAPSIVFVLLDSVRLDDVGWGGAERPTTPRLDALARRGVAFHQAVSQAPWTKPSVATLLTGLTPSHHGATGRFSALAESHRTLAEAFTSAGWRTFAASSNPNVTRLFGFDQGFTGFYERVGAPAEELIEEARKALHPGEPSERPFFLYLHLNDAHYPYDPPAVSRTATGELKVRGRFNRSGRYPLLDGATETAFRTGGGSSFSEEDVEAMRLAYDEEILYLDDQVGALVERLLAVRDDVLVVIVSDHGEEFLEHGDLGHGHSLYDELVRVPLQVAWSDGLGERLRLTPGTHGGQVRSMDLTPTLLEIAGIPGPLGSPAPMGESLLPLLRGEGRRATAVPPAEAADEIGLAAEDRLAFSETDYLGSPLSGPPGPLRGLRTPRAKLVISDPWFEPTAGRTWLFDLAADPGEHVNLASRRPALIETMLRTLEASPWLVQRDLRGITEVQLSEAQREGLAALGYVGDDLDALLHTAPSFAPGAVPWVANDD